MGEEEDYKNGNGIEENGHHKKHKHKKKKHKKDKDKKKVKTLLKSSKYLRP